MRSHLHTADRTELKLTLESQLSKRCLAFTAERIVLERLLNEHLLNL